MALAVRLGTHMGKQGHTDQRSDVDRKAVRSEAKADESRTKNRPAATCGGMDQTWTRMGLA